jgi:hypothetical protein
MGAGDGDQGEPGVAASASKVGGNGAVKPPHKPVNWVEVATLTVLAMTLMAAAFAAYEGSVLSGATNNLVKTQTINAHRQLRAYVGVSPGGIENFGDSQLQKFTLIRKNYGTTPAYNVFVKESLVTVIHAGDKIPEQENTPSSLPGLLSLFPGISLPLTINGAAGLSKEQADSVREGKDVLFVYAGIVTYYDAFGEEHYTRYCWSFKGPSMTESDAEWCPGHNDSN